MKTGYIIFAVILLILVIGGYTYFKNKDFLKASDSVNANPPARPTPTGVNTGKQDEVEIKND